MVRVYTSPNGYSGKMYGESSLEIKDASGKVVFRTKERTVHNQNGLIKAVDSFPEYLRVMEGKHEGIPAKKEQ